MNAVRKHWSSFVAFAAALMSLFSGFLVAVPSSGGENHWYEYGKFLVAVCIGLWLVPEHTWNRRKHKWAWWTSALLLIILSSGFVMGYTKAGEFLERVVLSRPTRCDWEDTHFRRRKGTAARARRGAPSQRPRTVTTGAGGCEAHLESRRDRQSPVQADSCLPDCVVLARQYRRHSCPRCLLFNEETIAEAGWIDFARSNCASSRTAVPVHGCPAFSFPAPKRQEPNLDLTAAL